MLRSVSLIVQTTFRDSLSFDPFSFCQNRLPAPEVNVGWRQVFQALMVSLMIVVIEVASKSDPGFALKIDPPGRASMARYFDNFLVFFSFFSRIELFLNR